MTHHNTHTYAAIVVGRLGRKGERRGESEAWAACLNLSADVLLACFFFLFARATQPFIRPE